MATPEHISTTSYSTYIHEPWGFSACSSKSASANDATALQAPTTATPAAIHSEKSATEELCNGNQFLFHVIIFFHDHPTVQLKLWRRWIHDVPTSIQVSTSPGTKPTERWSSRASRVAIDAGNAGTKARYGYGTFPKSKLFPLPSQLSSDKYIKLTVFYFILTL